MLTDEPQDRSEAGSAEHVLPAHGGWSIGGTQALGEPRAERRLLGVGGGEVRVSALAGEDGGPQGERLSQTGAHPQHHRGAAAEGRTTQRDHAARGEVTQ